MVLRESLTARRRRRRAGVALGSCCRGPEAFMTTLLFGSATDGYHARWHAVVPIVAVSVARGLCAGPARVARRSDGGAP